MCFERQGGRSKKDSGLEEKKARHSPRSNRGAIASQQQKEGGSHISIKV